MFFVGRLFERSYFCRLVHRRLARPSSPKLYRAYDRAVEDILRAGNILQIIEEDKLPEYAERTISELVFPEN